MLGAIQRDPQLEGWGERTQRGPKLEKWGERTQRFTENANRGLSLAYDFFRIPQALATIIYETSPREDFRQHSKEVASAATITLSAVSAFRAVVTLGHIASGAIFRKEKDDVTGKEQDRDWMSIAITLALYVGRLLSPVAWFNRVRPFLGHHAKQLGIVIMSAFTIVGVLCLIQSVRDWLKAKDSIVERSEKIRQKAINEGKPLTEDEITIKVTKELRHKRDDVISSGFEALTWPAENGLVGLGLGGSIVNLISATFIFFKTWRHS